MKPEDILFNGWYYFITSNKTKKLFQVKRIHKNCVMDKDGTFMPLIHIQPITITPAILLKNGFIEINDDEKWYRMQLLEENDFVGLKNFEDNSWVFAAVVFPNLINHLSIKYVHELQLAFKLCKIYKTIKL